MLNAMKSKLRWRIENNYIYYIQLYIKMKELLNIRKRKNIAMVTKKRKADIDLARYLFTILLFKKNVIAV